MTIIRDQAQTTLNQPQQIIGNALAGVDDSVSAELPSIPSARRNIRRQRKEADNALAVPASRALLPHPLPQEFRTTTAGAIFRRYDSGDQDRILIFATDDRLQLAENNSDWLIDGTLTPCL